MYGCLNVFKVPLIHAVAHTVIHTVAHTVAQIFSQQVNTAGGSQKIQQIAALAAAVHGTLAC